MGPNFAPLVLGLTALAVTIAAAVVFWPGRRRGVTALEEEVGRHD